MMSVIISQNYPDERRKILDGTYPTKIVLGRQRKHIAGTIEFSQNQIKMQKEGSEPAILEADAEELVKKYKGTGKIRILNGSLYPYETIDTNSVVGKTWVKSLQKYVKTKRIRIVYSSNGVHVIPVSDYGKGL